MHIGHPTTKPALRQGACVLVAALGLLLAGNALAASTIDASSFANETGTVWQFLRAHSSRVPGNACYNGGGQPTETYTCLQQALSTAGLDQRLRGAGPITLFAPTDAGFKALAQLIGPGAFGRLMQDKKKLTAVLEGMMVKGRYTPPDLRARSVPATGRLTLPTVTGKELLLTFDRFPSASGRVKVAVGRETFDPAWTPYLSGTATLLNNGAVIPTDMVYLPTSMR